MGAMPERVRFLGRPIGRDFCLIREPVGHKRGRYRMRVMTGICTLVAVSGGFLCAVVITGFEEIGGKIKGEPR